MRSHGDFMMLLDKWSDQLRPVVDQMADETVEAVYTEMCEVWLEEMKLPEQF